MNIKTSVSIIVIFALMVPNITKMVILIDFAINQEFIANVLCVNKEQPIVTCKGKCYLSDQLKKVDEQEQNQIPTNSKTDYQIFFYQTKKEISSYNCLSPNLSVNKHFDKNQFYNYNHIQEIFHPPKFNLFI